MVDEARINAAVAAHYGVPVALVTGDDCVCGELSRAMPSVEVAPVKRSIDRLSAQHVPIRAARDLIRTRAATATAASRPDASSRLRPSSPHEAAGARTLVTGVAT